ncbi:hypothetical protein N8I74_18860 [Chitiniphilus purpureus]|uniref:Uncharacterized protein n=1 Tax=Chitiniphilus purpureus TaxID=2981137 RepID=A0ABY6DU03_9NEIS|nr:hypothetical protein [Chitiniphilus sp. CD1]UXY15343.1 hypothetical protein N8I74_18860 [Chitiniphilus sp. CD1]
MSIFKSKFFDFFEENRKEWPDTIDLSEIRYKDKRGSYTVSGLGVLSDSIEWKSIGREDEIMLRCLHLSIYEVLHAAAIFVTSIKTEQIRAEEVQRIFERRLYSMRNSKELDVDESDKKNIDIYFLR